MSPTFLAVMPSLTETDLGLCYLSIGAEGIAGALSSGKLVDWELRRAKKRTLLKQGLQNEDAVEKAKDTRGRGKYEGIENIERARLGLSPFYWGSFVVLVVGYGWTANQKVHIAFLLVLQFLAVFQVTAIFTVNQTLLMDLFPGRGASVTASNNLVRCLTGAVLRYSSQLSIISSTALAWVGRLRSLTRGA